MRCVIYQMRDGIGCQGGDEMAVELLLGVRDLHKSGSGRCGQEVLIKKKQDVKKERVTVYCSCSWS